MNWIDTQLPILPVLLPAATAIVLLLMGDHGGDDSAHGHRKLLWARRLALVSGLLGLIIAARLVAQASGGEIRAYLVGEWPAPYGIAIVIDRLGALMLLLTALVAVPVLWYASGGWDAHGRYFHALFQFQLMGLNGAFVTGDLFNLFVFFEVLLIASYVLMVHGQGQERFRVGLHYVVLNLAASALFLIGVSLLYAKTGTLNLADLALRVPKVSGPDALVVQAAAWLLLVVFGFKAALLPLSLWLPATYAAACAPVAALFAIMTKVGVYAIWRVHGVVFGADAGDSAYTVEPLLLPLALGTSVLGVLGALSARTMERLVAWLTVSSVGTVLVALGLFSEAAWSAGLYYMVNSTLVIAGLFLLAELVAAQRGDAADRLEPASPVAQPTLLGLMLLLGAASSAGLPPLPGFIGKLMLMEAATPHTWQVAVWATVLGVGFFTMIGLARAGSILFWHVREDLPSIGHSGTSPKLLGATLLLLAATVAMSVFAAPIQRYTTAAAVQLGDRAAYARAVLGARGAATESTRPYDGMPPPPTGRGTRRRHTMTPASRDDTDSRTGGWLPHPALSLVLAVVWLLLQQSLAPAQILSAIVLALAVPKLVHGFLGEGVRPRSLPAIGQLAMVVLWDIVVSNLTVARIVLNPASDPQPAWVEVPLEAVHPTAVTLLATIITMTPGTLSCSSTKGAAQSWCTRWTATTGLRWRHRSSSDMSDRCAASSMERTHDRRMGPELRAGRRRRGAGVVRLAAAARPGGHRPRARAGHHVHQCRRAGRSAGHALRHRAVLRGGAADCAARLRVDRGAGTLSQPRRRHRITKEGQWTSNNCTGPGRR